MNNGIQSLPFNAFGKCAIIFVGLQASGKTSFYQQMLVDKGFVHINLDTLHTRNKEHLLMEECVRQSQSVVIDNTNPTAADRERYIPFFKAHGYHIIGLYFQSRLQECLARNEQRERVVKRLAVLGTYNKLQLPQLAEGFDDRYYITLNNNNFTINTWQNEI